VKSESATVEKLLSTLKAYSPQADESLLLRAFQFAEKAHTGQTRASGEDYITHPLEVAMILTETHMDVETLVAAVLHDVVERHRHQQQSNSRRVWRKRGPAG
jgi:GTP diphosphokinase / guanosine-3',5'-bis(diphosphate) 3'-diphosphatase